MDLTTWLELVYINPDIPLRTPGSKHQKKIREIHNAIEQAKQTGEIDPILNIDHIACSVDYEIVAYCRYLQHAINVLKNEG